MSTVILDTITGKSTATTITIGSTPVVSASANSMTIRGEGSNQTSIQQGLIKVWINFDGTGTPSARDSFNVGSITDNGSGSYDIVFTTAMSNTNYSSQCSLNNGTTDVSGAHDYGWAIVDRTTADFRWDSENASNSQTDLALLDALVVGDLA